MRYQDTQPAEAPRRYPAQLVFRQEEERVWRGRLLNPLAAQDVNYAAHDEWTPAACFCQITEYGLPPGARLGAAEEPRARYELVTQGAEPGGRRYRTIVGTLTDAQEAAIKWAARRFYVEM